MKIKLLAIALLSVVIGFGACGGKDNDKSSECKITQFTVNNVDYIINGTSITYLYPKTDPNVWTGLPQWKVAPKIIVSAKAKIEPEESVPQNFEEGATYIVTAEDGTTKQTYTVKAERGQ